MRVRKLFWNDDNVEHLWAAHQVTTDEVEDIVFGIDGEPASYQTFRDGINYKIFGETGGGRLLVMVGAFMQDGRLRVFAARDMDEREKRTFRTR